MLESAPDFVPAHPKFIGKAKVRSSELTAGKDNSDGYFYVDLAKGVCTCHAGAPFFSYKGEVKQRYCCIHKLKAISSLVEKADDASMRWSYLKLVAERYNRYETVSVFHKELRRGDIKRAIFWAGVLSTQRKMRGVIEYMLNIIYEETRDHTLHKDLLDMYERADLAYGDMYYMVARFCLAPKKWELPHRWKFLNSEMRAYMRLAYKYTYEIAKGGDIVPKADKDILLSALYAGFKEANSVKVQYGLKGLLKIETSDKEANQVEVLNLLVPVINQEYENNFEYSHAGVLRLYAIICKHLQLGLRAGYHGVNALADALCGEPYGDGLTSPLRRKIALKFKRAEFPLGVAYPVPMYAQDNHTWAGKSLMKKYYNQLFPGVKQTHLDHRWCGAYNGVVWRHLAYKQKGTCKVKWHEVRFPVWLSKHTVRMYY